MFLKSLELNGFKSFAQKTVLEFPKGITAIVGPNGSGKSNIIDAIRWLLGEREAKNLRGSKIENLIFAGTPKRSRVGMASVGLFFDNSSGFSQIDFSEILVLRRVSRDGVSQYFLNKSETRLKDIIDFFARSRLGTKGLTVINQGSSDLFVRVSPEERRVMIEEVLGLREFQIKKSEAERKLENTNFNLEKVKAMIEEVIPRLRMLKRQTVKWQKRAEVEKELKELEDNYFSFKAGGINEEKQKIEFDLKALEKRISEKISELRIFESEVKKIEGQSSPHNLNLLRSRKNELSEKYLKIQKELSRLEAKLEILGNQEAGGSFGEGEILNFIGEIKDGLKDGLALEEIKEAAAMIERLISRIDDFLNRPQNRKIEELRELEESRQGLIKEIGTAEEGIKEVEKSESEIALGLEEFNKRFQKAYGFFEQKKDELSVLESQKQKILFEKEKLDLKFRDLEVQMSQAGRRIEELGKSEIKNGEPNLMEVEKQMFKLRAELANIGEIDEFLLKEAETVEKHHNFLSSQVEDLEKASDDLKILIKELKEKIKNEFNKAIHLINEKFDHFFRLMFEGGHAKLKIKSSKLKVKNDDSSGENESDNDETGDGEEQEQEEKIGIEIELNLPKKKITNLEMLSGGEKSLVSVAALFALISVSPPPFLVLDEIDAALDERNSRRFANLVKESVSQTQFIVVTHNRAVMEIADVLYGVTMNEDGTSKVLSLKLDNQKP